MNRSFLRTLSLVCALVPSLAVAGDWTTIPSPSAGNQANALSSVAAVDDNDVWSVGWSFNRRFNAYRTVAEHWTGTAWSIVPTPNATNGYNLLNGVAAVSASDVWAVGQAATGGTYATLILHWNGASWSIVPSPNVAGRSNVLQAISIVSDDDIWAVGNSQDANFENFPLAVHWNGSAWSIVSTPAVDDDLLLGVTALAPDDVWAVGRSKNEARTLTMHWDGSAWSVVPSPNDGFNDNILWAVAGSGSTDVWAVGNAGSLKTLAMHWNGSIWSVVSTPAFTGNNNNPVLAGLVAMPGGDLWAAGQFLISSAIQQTLTETWNGSSWSIVTSPNATNSNNRLRSIAATPDGTLWAVGVVGKFGKPERTLTMRKNP